MSTPVKISPTVARRLAITRQRLAGPRPSPDQEGFLDMLRDIGCDLAQGYHINRPVEATASK